MRPAGLICTCLLVLMVLPLCIAETPDEADLAAIVESSNRFALELYDRLSVEEGNLFLSPYSVSSAMSMAYAGAEGRTALEMAQALQLPADQTALRLRRVPAWLRWAQQWLGLTIAGLSGQVHDTIGGLTDELNGDGTPRAYELTVANALWGQQGTSFLPGFVDVLERCYGGGPRDVDFAASAESARLTINDWIEQQTQGRIADFIREGGVNEATRLVLTNAIYFRSEWEHMFPEALTAPAPFHREPGQQVQVAMMAQRRIFKHAARRGLQLLELPYKNGDLSMLILLPETADDLSRVEAVLSPGRLARWTRQMADQDVQVYLPRFKVTSEFKLNDVLVDMGMHDAFVTPSETGGADFSGMTGGRDWSMDTVVHKAFVSVDEAGTEATGATGIVIGSGPNPAIFRADRPFLFLIRDTQTGVILFIGRVVSP